MKLKNRKLTFFTILLLIAVTVYIAISGINIGGYEVQSVADSMKLGLDIKGGVVVVYEAKTDATGDDLAKLMTQTKNVMGRRINEFGLTEPNITVQGEKRIRIELPGVKDTQEALSAIGKTAQLEFLRVLPGQTIKVQTEEDGEKEIPLFATEYMTKEDFDYEMVLVGDDVKDSKLSSDENGKPAVALELNDSGKEAFYQATKAGGQIAILLDGEVISAPYAGKAIPDGKAIISGSFSVDEAAELASLIRGGALPVDMKEVQTSVIGPTLGLNALTKSVYGAKIGLLLVILFLIGYYKLPGLIASISLTLYGALLTMVMIAFDATLTLPGVAGIVLSLGMAVDANVIIFERLKEELKNGKTIRSSLNFGFKRAMRTILDANITTFIAGIVLYNFGEGPIKGFAITLMIGLLASMFTAIIVSKALLLNGLALKALNNKKLYRA